MSVLIHSSLQKILVPLGKCFILHNSFNNYTGAMYLLNCYSQNNICANVIITFK